MPPHVVNAYYHPVRNEIVFPAGHPAAAVLRRRRRRRRQLRRHRHRHRARGHPRLRRPGPPVRRRRRVPRLVDRGGPGALHRPGRAPRRAVRRVRRRRRGARQRPPHPRREHRRPRRHRPRPAGARARERRLAGHRRPHPGAAVLPRQRRRVARQHERGARPHPRAGRPAQPAHVRACTARCPTSTRSRRRSASPTTRPMLRPRAERIEIWSTWAAPSGVGSYVDPWIPTLNGA